MKHPGDAFVLTALIASIAACGQSEEGNSAATSTPVVAEKGVTAAGAPAAETPANAVGEPSTQKQEPTEKATERVAETEEGAEAIEEPANKASAPLKLAQLPPRVPAGSKFKEGVHYLRLSPTQPVSVSPDQVQIVEFFWYGCPHCNAIDPRVEAWRKSTQPGGKPDFVVFSRIPAVLNDRWRFHARFYYAAESLGKLEELHPLVFREIHEKGNPLDTIDLAREFFAAHDVDAQAFQKNFGAMSLERKLDDANKLAQRDHVSSVPTFVVNGKYTLDVPSAGGEEQLFALLNELAARERAKE
jgi:thiol:disulfide interchange protein DsbA